jgi:hypothetical protein
MTEKNEHAVLQILSRGSLLNRQLHCQKLRKQQLIFVEDSGHTIGAVMQIEAFPGCGDGLICGVLAGLGARSWADDL